MGTALAQGCRCAAGVVPVRHLDKDFEPALAEFFGSEAGLSASTIQRLTREWSQELAAFQRRDLSQVDYVYLWADGVHFNIRLERDRLCCLVLLGVRADGHKELIAVGDGFRKSSESWAEELRDLKRRGMLVIGDGTLGFGVRFERSSPRLEQRCWVHKIAECSGCGAVEPATESQGGAPQHHECREQGSG